jgi:tetratricopeptide (TPR) repeat protein
MDEDPSQRRDLLPILAESQLNALAPRAEQALETIETFLSDSTLLPKQRWSAKLIHVRVLIKLGRWDRVRDAIDQAMQADVSLEVELEKEQLAYRDELRLLQSVTEVSRAIKRYGRYGDGVVSKRPSQARLVAELRPSVDRMHTLQREATPSLAAQARLWTARAYLVQGMIEEALTQLMVVRQQRPFRAEAIVGALEEIELLARLGRGVELLQTTRYMMRELGDDQGFDASLITFNEFQRRLMGAIEQLRLQGQYQCAIDAARGLPPVVDVVEALTQEGIGFREWAAATLAAGTDLSGQVAQLASLQARARYRAAGDAFAQAAELQFNTPEYVATQWSAIEAYQQGRHFERSIHLLQTYLRYEDRSRLPRGLVAYGRALLAENDPDTAIEALTTCIIEYPRDPLRYDARLMAALAYAEKSDLDQAKRLLQDNLQDGELTPQSPAWRDSLMTLGELLYQRGYRNHLAAQQSPQSERLQRLRENQPILQEAIRRLDEAVERYWPVPRATAAAYLAAKTRVMSSQLPRVESELPEILDAARRSLQHQADQKLQRALDGFVGLRVHLARQEEEQRLPEKERSMLRNCLMAEADVLRDMNRVEEASSAYRTVELRYMNEPTALEAIMGRIACAKTLGRTREADLLVRQAKVVLQRIPPEMDEQFAMTTRYDRPGWEDYLGWMNQRTTPSGV